jgi:methylase of polypeptide subunit release factors
VLTSDPAVGLIGKFEPEIALELIERAAAAGRPLLVGFLKEETGRTPQAIEKLLDTPCDADRYAKMLAACENDDDLTKRIQPFHALLRDDLRGLPTVYLAGSVYVTKSGERRSSGTYYTPRTLAEEMVRYALEPLVYSPGPQVGADPKDWKLRSPTELLDLKVCDMAMGSGAFLVGATRYLSDRLVEAWAELGEGRFTPEGEPTTDEVLVVPDQPAEQLGLAHRLVAERCIYGVDKNPMAVEMAKLSMWLVTLAKDRPFSFLDHALKCGDSLLGVHDLAQIEFLHPDPEHGKELHTTLEEHWHVWQGAVKGAIDRRRELEAFTVLSVRDAELKRRLLQEADVALDSLRVVGDAIVGAALSASPGGANQLDIRLLEMESDIAAALDPDRKETDRRVRLDNMRTEALFWLNEGKPPAEVDRRPLHWPLEFPEVFVDRGGFDVIVGNPPFQGGQKISGTLGADYRSYLVAHVASGRQGSADLVAYFFLRAAAVLRPAGIAGLLATNTISEGATRDVGLEQITDRGMLIVRARKTRPWPGGANLQIGQVWISRRDWSGECSLDGEGVSRISAALEPQGRIVGTPYRLQSNAGRAFQASIVLGMGFVLDAETATVLMDLDARNREVLMPYMNGEDVNSRPDVTPSRWVVNFFDWSIERARSYPDCFEIVERTVRPERERLLGRNPIGTKRAKYWWRFGSDAKSLYSRLRGDQTLVCSEVTKHLCFVFVPTTYVYSANLDVFPDAGYAEFAVLQSIPHELWARSYCSHLETRLKYSPGNGYGTFPFPGETVRLAEAGNEYHSSRARLMDRRGEGLTRIYNRVHDPEETAADVSELRRLHVGLDKAVVSAYGWDDLALDHDFYDTPQGVKFTLAPNTRVELLDRLLELNHARYAEELAAGLHSKKPGRSKVAAVPGDQRGFEEIE